MPLATTTVNGTITLPDGGGISTAIIAFSLVRFQTVSPYVIPTANKTANIAANGDFTVELAPNDPAQAPTYLVTLTVYNSSGAQVHSEQLGYIAVPDIGPVELADLIVLDPPESTQADALAQALAAAAAAAGQAVLAQGYADDAELSAIDAANSATLAAAYATPFLDDIAAVLADTSLSYGAGAGQVQAGDFVRTRAEGYALEVAASGAVDHDIETAGGVKFYVRPFPCAFETRAGFLAAIAAGYVWADGTVVTAGNQSYRKDGSTDIIDIPGWTWHGEETFWHHGGDFGDPDLPTRVTIRHERTGTYAYDVIEIFNPRPNILNKEPGDNFDPLDGTQDVLPIRDVALSRGHQVVINCDASFNAGGGRYVSSGLQIVDGVAIQDFEDADYRREAVVMYRDGRMRAARLSDGLSAQDYVDDGAVWSAGWGWLLVVDGVGQVPTGTLSTTVSARTVVGQRANGDMVVIQVEGKTGAYGVTGSDLVSLCLSEGLYFAMNLDGGGSTQCWWSEAYSMPSSDTTERTLAGYLVVNVPNVPRFDTGRIALSLSGAQTGSILLRQVGCDIGITILTSGTYPLEAYTQLTQIPQRFWPKTGSDARASGSGARYNLINIGMSTPINGDMFARPKQAADVNVYGRVSYRARWSTTGTKPV